MPEARQAFQAGQGASLWRRACIQGEADQASRCFPSSPPRFRYQDMGPGTGAAPSCPGWGAPVTGGPLPSRRAWTARLCRAARDAGAASAQARRERSGGLPQSRKRCRSRPRTSRRVSPPAIRSLPDPVLQGCAVVTFKFSRRNVCRRGSLVSSARSAPVSVARSQRPKGAFLSVARLLMDSSGRLDSVATPPCRHRPTTPSRGSACAGGACWWPVAPYNIL
mmetsp:Transcript_36145/g.91218  ORF Transcript_36145/g.91218 Transcript_36145/m.91218 type:complete len:222 (-) Transcript_36145:404-1069(-)